MPIYYSENYIQRKQKKLKKCMKPIKNNYLRESIKYLYIKKFYVMLYENKSMIVRLQKKIINFIKFQKEIHKRLVVNLYPHKTKLLHKINIVGNIACEYQEVCEESDSDDSDVVIIHERVYTESESESEEESDE